MPDETHIGDGVYASHDGFCIWLRVERDGRDERIALEPAVLTALVEFAKGIGVDVTPPSD
jgi:hypothetical protein